MAIELRFEDLHPVAKEAAAVAPGTAEPGAGGGLGGIDNILATIEKYLTQAVSIKQKLEELGIDVSKLGFPMGQSPGAKPPMIREAPEPSGERRPEVGIEVIIKAKLVEVLKKMSAAGLGKVTLEQFYDQFKGFSLDDIIAMLEGKPPPGEVIDVKKPPAKGEKENEPTKPA